MGIGVSIFFITLGAILKFAVDPSVLKPAVDLGAIGVIFMVIGGIGLVLSFAFARGRGSTSDNTLQRNHEPPNV